VGSSARSALFFEWCGSCGIGAGQARECYREGEIVVASGDHIRFLIE
jgi:hypothetical protein